MWCVVHEGNVYNKLECIDDVANLVFLLTHNWSFTAYLRRYLVDKEVDWEEDFEEQTTFIWRYR